MMNKKVGIGVLTAAIALGTMGTVTAATTTNSNSGTTTATTSNLIGEAKAKQIALTKVPGGTIDGVDLERKNGKLYYEVDVDKANSTQDVDVYINAVSGAVLKVVNDDDDRDDDNNNQTTTTTNANAKVKTEAQAKAIAIKEINGTVTKVDRDSDDGRVTYEVDLNITGGEATVEIDAATGKVLSVDKDYDHDDDNDSDDYDND